MSAFAQRLAANMTRPSFYLSPFRNTYASYSKKPIMTTLTHFATFVFVVNYTLEYITIGKYHVAHKNHEIEDALKEYREKHGSHGH
eukprot:CAMPEP_0113318436 /NCGR_PEP_ID=MMETSP0010_2-20120614/13005_1 /TAXON_ID=216773 ORGANISM="Corethron hystrix, Strain 308" /NCGR_SAMPLE_ID=MMETSP0010_2 /ASSEMBLY_ACC=CAM_ASM_000155 /LENGTH=85 /DNA_ID=CAMNT_0000175737 /DNA_START=471 /DNA_END=728 /DNA_ORIENTATION=+ /assembly_acc=CAM_ASM_000155